MQTSKTSTWVEDQLNIQFHAPVYVETVNILFKRDYFLEDVLLLDESAVSKDKKKMGMPVPVWWDRIAVALASGSCEFESQWCHSHLLIWVQENKIGCSQGERGGILLSGTAVLANRGHLWAHSWCMRYKWLPSEKTWQPSPSLGGCCCVMEKLPDGW